MIKIYTVLNALLFTSSFAFSAFAMQNAELFELANKKLQQHQYDEAKIHIKNLIKAQPSNISARFLKVEILLATEQALLAETELNVIESLGGDLQQITLQRGNALLMRNKYNEMLRLFQDNYIDQVFAAKMQVLKGLAHLGLRQLNLSEAAFNQALKLNPNNVEAILGLAQLKLNYYRYQEALVLVEPILNSPFPPEKAWLLKASIEQSIGNSALALESINKVLVSNPVHTQGLILRATLLFENKNFSAANTDVLTILKAAPYEPRARFIQAALAANKGDLTTTNQLVDETLQTLTSVDEGDLATSPAYIYLAAVIFHQQGQYTLASEYINQYLEIDSFNVSAKLLLAKISMEQGNYISAKSQLIKSNIEHPKNLQILSLLGVCFLELQQFEQALAYFQQVKSLNVNTSVDLQLARTYLSLNQNTTAIKLLKKGDFIGQQQIIAGFLLVKAYLKERQADNAVKIAQQLTQAEPKNIDFLHHLGFVYQSIGDVDNAILQYKQALAINARHVKSIISLAEIERGLGQPSKGIKQLQDAIQVLPNDIDLLKAIAGHYEHAGRAANATAMYKRALQQQANSEDLMLLFATSLARENKFDEAQDAIISHLLSHEKTAKLYMLLGRLYLITKQTELALRSYREALKFDVDKSKLYFYIAKAYQADSKFSDALSAYQKSIAWGGNSPEPVLALANYLNSESRPNEAIKVLLAFDGEAKTSEQFIALLAQSYYLNSEYRKAEQSYLQIISTDSVNVVAGLALVYQEMTKSEQAIALLRAKIGTEELNDNTLLLATLGEIYIKNQRWLEAESIYNTLIQLNPNLPILLNNAAFIAMSQSKLEQAKNYATHSVALVGNSPDSLDTLGWIYYLTNEYAQALPLLRKALAIDYSNVEIKYHMALTLKALGQDKEAFNLMREVVNSQNDFANKSQALQTLELWAKS